MFFNEKYKSYDIALKESDGIVIVVKFCKLLPEYPQRYHEPLLSGLCSPNTRPVPVDQEEFSQMPYIEKYTNEDRRNLRSHYTELKIGRAQNMTQYDKPMPVTQENENRWIPRARTSIAEKTSHMSSQCTNTIQTNSTVYSGTESNIFIEEVAKNIRFVHSVNTSKLIHAYSIDQLLPAFTENYFFYLSM